MTTKSAAAIATTTQPPSQGIQLSEKERQIDLASQKIELAIGQGGYMATRGLNGLRRAIRLSEGVNMIRSVLTDQFMNENIMPLQNTALGFLTDKNDGKGYPLEVVREVMCEALLRGFQPTGNEFNIIAGRFYGAKSGFERNVLEFPGLSHFEMDLGVPSMGDKGALVPCRASWKLNGRPDELLFKAPDKDSNDLDLRIPVRINAGMGPDAVLGKATRKLYARVYQRLTNCERSLENDPGDVINTTATALPAPADPSQDGKRMKLGGKPPEPAPVTSAAPPAASSSAVDELADGAKDDFNRETGELPMRDSGID